MSKEERFELFGEHCIKDNSPDARCQLLNTYQAYVILNEQDKRIKELETTNKVLSNELTKNNIMKQDRLENCCGIPIYEIPALKEENQQLKQQLAEKEKEFVRLNKFLQAMKIREHNQDEISFAIEQLELARRRIDRLGYNENKCLNKKDCIEDCLEEIDNQIKELKGE